MLTYLIKFRINLLLIPLSFLSWGCLGQSNADISNQKTNKLAYSQIKPQIIELDLPAQYDRAGGLIVADVNGDSQKDFIVTKPGHIVVYNHLGQKLWAKQLDIQVTTGKANSTGLPGLHGAGVQVADVDGDKNTEVLFLKKDKTLHIVQGKNGNIKRSIKLESPAGTERWEHLVIANFRGKGDRDLLLQTTNAKGYRMGRYLAAYAIDDLLKLNKPKPLWTQDDFLASAHSGARVADLNGDGKDEVLGGTIIAPNGKLLLKIPLKGHIDSLFVADVRPDIPGLEVVVLEEGGDNYKRVIPGNNFISNFGNNITNKLTQEANRVFLYNRDRLIWTTHYKHQEPQNAVVGDLDPSRPGLEIWNRSRYNEHQKPFVFDAQGKLIANYNMDDVAPKGWTSKGVEVIFTIDWTGDSRQLAAAKERHKSGDIGIFNPINGQFIHRFQEKADRLYVADISGDWREELIVLSGNQLRVYSNPEPNPNLNRPRLWSQPHYRRSKMTWNYYNP
ncbi:FG-GAP-like repeat-containing protein [Calothrix rhizosoleniae]|uniref:rhamnogalacturonan lyase family protein n=1 Tax=Calothrix rhizosoleniae TaxID=888997 RepID=UPI001178B9C6|nr:FG-GAP-like repeat-containing protein [Calothrix rhizosoleniae]